MRLLIAVASLLPLLIAGCASRDAGGTVSRQVIAPCALVVLPVGDAQRVRVRVFGSGSAMTDALMAELKRRGFAPVLCAGDDAAVRAAATTAGTKMVLAANFLEYQPDLALYLQAEDVDTGAMLSYSVAVLGSISRSNGTPQAVEIGQVARTAVETLVNPPPVDDTTSMRPAFKD